MNATKLLTTMVLLGVGVAAGWGISQWRMNGQMSMDAGTSETGMDGEPDILYWVAPMDANFRRDKPGQSPMGMDLVPVYAGEQSSMDGSGAIRVAPQVVQNLGVRVAPVERASFASTIDTVGYTGWDEATLTMLHPRTEGWLEQFGIDSVGDRVSTGDVLYEVYAPKLVSAQREYLTARAAGNRGLTRASRSRLVALGLNETQIRALERRGSVEERLTWRAERNAVVTGIMARKGSYVTPQTAIATLVDPTRIWIEVEVLQSQAGQVREGQPATARFDAWPSEPWVGEVAYIYPELNPLTRTLRLRLRFANPDQRLKPNMFARVTLESPPSEPVLQVPREAVIPAAGGERVVEALGEGRFAVLPVITGRRSASAIEILDGLQEGQRVVTSGQFLLDSEASGTQALERINALRTVTATAEIAGFPRRGKLRLIHAPIPEIDWPQMNRVFDVAPGVNLMPFNKQDQVRFTMRETLDGSWEVVQVEAAKAEMDMDHSGMSGAPMRQPGMNDSSMRGGMEHDQMDHADMGDKESDR